MARYIPIFLDLLDDACELTNEEFGRLIRACLAYADGRPNYGDYITGNEKYVFSFLRGQIDRSIEIKAVRARAGATRKEQEETNGNKAEQIVARANDNNNNNNNNNNNKQKRFMPPTVEEVKKYCSQRGNNVDAQNFVDFYTAKGWRVGNNPMKDWQACIRTWERRDKTQSFSPQKKVLPAQAYTQRSYEGEDDRAIERMLAKAREDGMIT